MQQLPRFIAAPLFFLLFATILQAQPTPMAITTASGMDGKYQYTTYLGDPLKARYYKLDNGLTVILSVNRNEPRVQTFILTKAGSKNDPATNTGLAHYLEHMLFKGTDKFGTLNWEKERKELAVIEDLYDQYNHTTDEAKRKVIYGKIDSVSGVAATYAIANEYDKMVGAIGASGTNAFTSTEVTAYMNDIPSNQLAKWLRIEGERFRAPVMRLFHTELEAVYEEKNISLDDDGDKVWETLNADLFRNHPYGTQTTIGTVEHLKNPSLKEIENYFRTYYVPNNMGVILVGDFDPAEAIALVDKSFNYMTPKPIPNFTFKPEETRNAPREHNVYGPEPEHLRMAWRFPGAGTDEALLLEMTDLLLAYKGAGLLDLDLNKKQLVQNASCSPDFSKDYSTHVFYGAPKEGQSLEEVKGLILQEIEKIKRGEFDETSMRGAIRNLKVDQMTQYESNGGGAFALLTTFVTGVDPAWEAQKYANMAKITKEQIVDFAKKYYTNDYAVVYKRLGEAEEVAKVEKPAITPVEVNRVDQSPFVTSIITTPAPPIQPVYVDYGKDIAKSKLANGAEVLSVQNKENDLFQLYYVLDMGSDNDKKLPFAVNYLRYLGTDKYSSEELSTKFFDLACNFNVSSGRDQVYVTLSGPDESFEPALALFEEFLANAKPDQAALDGVIARTLKGRTDAKQNKSVIHGQGLVNYALYGEKNPFNDVLSNEQLKEMSAKELVDRIHKLTSYQHKVLYYGPKATTSLTSLLEKYHKTPKSLLPYPVATKYSYKSTDKNVVYFADYDMVQAEIIWIRNAEPYNAGTLPVRSVFNEYFGGGMSAVVFQEIRESKALAYSTFSIYESPSKPENPHLIFSYVGTQADKLKDAVGAMNELHTTLPRSEQSFATAIGGLKNKIETERTLRSDILFNYLNAQKFGQNYDSRQVVYDNLDKITFNDLEKCHHDRYTGKPYLYCVIGSQDKIDMEALKKLGEVKELKLDTLFGY